ncbi:MAG TPA: aldo/keto reductase [Steroidobacteraceae bacterium]|nr:aldo/keto reductase [Steroidobacteraceae bacterium]
MQRRRLGAQGLEVSALGLGTMGMTGVAGMADMYGPADDAEGIATIQRALDIGVNFFDTAEVYGPYRNEELVGRALAGRRQQAVIATKFGFKFTTDGRIDGLDSRPENVRRALDGALQSEYSLWERNIEGAVIDTCRELGIGIVPYSPLGRGFLTGTIPMADELPGKDYRRHDPRFQRDNYARNARVLGAVQAVARRHTAPASQIALAWLLQQGDDIVPIPGTKRRSYLESNAAATAVQLRADDLATLNAVGAAAGARYTERGMATIDR